jgi:hypothetical protein
LLYVARADAGPVVQACLAAGSISALALAFDCADQASELAPILRARLDALLVDAGNPLVGLERRRLMAAVAATRHLRDCVRVADGGPCLLAADYDRDLPAVPRRPAGAGRALGAGLPRSCSIRYAGRGRRWGPRQ